MRNLHWLLVIGCLSGCLHRQDAEQSQLIRDYPCHYTHEGRFYTPDFATLWYCFPPASMTNRAVLALRILEVVSGEEQNFLRPDGRMCVFVRSQTNALTGMATSFTRRQLGDQISSCQSKAELLERCGQWQWHEAMTPDTNDCAKCQGVELSQLLATNMAPRFNATTKDDSQ